MHSSAALGGHRGTSEQTRGYNLPSRDILYLATQRSALAHATNTESRDPIKGAGGGGTLSSDHGNGVRMPLSWRRCRWSFC